MQPDRINALDTTRGFAVMGILAMNIISFAMPQNAYISPLAWGSPTELDIGVWASNFVLIDSKMRGLFSMLFGASSLLVIDSALTAGRSAAGTHYARMATLALFGLLHFILLWSGDILLQYAIVGCCLYVFREASSRALVLTGGLFLLFNTLLTTSLYGALALGSLPGAPAELAAAHADFVAQFAPDSAASVAQYQVYRGDWLGIVAYRVIQDGAFIVTLTLQYFLETLGLMLIGMALYKSGMLRGAWSPGKLARWRNLSLGLGVAGNLVLLAWQFASDLAVFPVFLSTLVFSLPFDTVMSVGYAALFMGLAQRFGARAWIDRIRAAGRAAFSNYLGSSLVMTSLFYGYGLGLFGEVSRAALWLFVLFGWALMLLWSKPWLTRFYYGPMEWAWRSLSRFALQPMRRPAAAV